MNKQSDIYNITVGLKYFVAIDPKGKVMLTVSKKRAKSYNQYMVGIVAAGLCAYYEAKLEKNTSIIIPEIQIKEL